LIQGSCVAVLPREVGGTATPLKHERRDRSMRLGSHVSVFARTPHLALGALPISLHKWFEQLYPGLLWFRPLPQQSAEIPDRPTRPSGFDAEAPCASPVCRESSRREFEFVGRPHTTQRQYLRLRYSREVVPAASRPPLVVKESRRSSARWLYW